MIHEKIWGLILGRANGRSKGSEAGRSETATFLKNKKAGVAKAKWIQWRVMLRETPPGPDGSGLERPRRAASLWLYV